MVATAIWMPRYWDKKVLINTRDVRQGKNYIFFCCDNKLPDLYSYDGTRVRGECKIGTNGKIAVYEVPLEWLNNEGPLPEALAPIKQTEYTKYKKTLKRKK